MDIKLSDLNIKKIKEKYPGKIPVIVNRANNSTDIPEINKNKFLVSSNITVGQFIYIIRRQIKLPPEKALFIFVNNNLPSSSILMSELYSTYKSSNDILYILYTSENTFGLYTY